MAVEAKTGSPFRNLAEKAAIVGVGALIVDSFGVTLAGKLAVPLLVVAGASLVADQTIQHFR